MNLRAVLATVASTGLAFVLAVSSTSVRAQATCVASGPATISFITFQSPNLQNAAAPWTIEGKLSIPSMPVAGPRSTCVVGKTPAVLILHGSSGVDARGDFYEAALNAAGIATLQIDMWQARGVTSLANRPQLPIYTYPDAFAALDFLARQPTIDAARVGVMGFSWGGVVTLAAAEQFYNTLPWNTSGRRFAAHVANYPVCYGANNSTIPNFSPNSLTGTQFLHLTGAPVLIQIGTLDSYDNSEMPCVNLAASVNPSNNNVVSVNVYPNATHAFDRIMVPETELDNFANQGSYFTNGVVPRVVITPDVAQARQSRDRVTAFFRKALF